MVCLSISQSKESPLIINNICLLYNFENKGSPLIFDYKFMIALLLTFKYFVLVIVPNKVSDQLSHMGQSL